MKKQNLNNQDFILIKVKEIPPYYPKEYYLNITELAPIIEND